MTVLCAVSEQYLYSLNKHRDVAMGLGEGGEAQPAMGFPPPERCISPLPPNKVQPCAFQAVKPDYTIHKNLSCDRRPVGSPCRRGPAISKARLPTVESLTEDTERRLVPAGLWTRRGQGGESGTSGGVSFTEQPTDASAVSDIRMSHNGCRVLPGVCVATASAQYSLPEIQTIKSGSAFKGQLKLYSQVGQMEEPKVLNEAPERQGGWSL